MLQPFRPPVTQAPLYLPGIAGNYVSTPDAADLGFTGDIDIAVECALDDWSLDGASQALAAKYGATPQRSYRLVVTSGAKPRFEWTTDGSFSTAVQKDSTVALPFGNGQRGIVRVTFDADNGAGGSTTRFYAGTSWDDLTQLGADLIGDSTVTVHVGTAPFTVGASAIDANTIAAGRFYRVVVRDGINGEPLIDLDLKNPPTEWVADGVSRHDGTRVWTINGTRWAWRA